MNICLISIKYVKLMVPCCNANCIFIEEQMKLYGVHTNDRQYYIYADNITKFCEDNLD